MPASPDSGVVNLSSTDSVAATVQRLERELAAQGMTIFARIDQQAAA